MHIVEAELGMSIVSFHTVSHEQVLFIIDYGHSVYYKNEVGR